MNRIYLPFILFLVLIGGAWAQPIADKKVIHISSEEYPPYTSQKAKNFGIDAHIVTEAFRNVGIKVIYEFYPGARSYAVAKWGDVDASLPWAKRAGRENLFKYSAPIIEVDGEHFFHLKTTKFNWDTLKPNYNRLAGTTMAAVKSHNFGPDFQNAEKQKVISVDRVSSLKIAFKMLLRGRIEVVIAKERVGNYVLQSSFKPEDIELLTSQPERIKRRSFDYLIFSRKGPDLDYYLEAFNRGLKQLRDSGRYDQLLLKLKKGDYAQPLN